MPNITRREFLKTLGLNLAATALPRSLTSVLGPAISWSRIELNDLPEELRGVLERVPPSQIDKDGFLHLLDESGTSKGRVSLRQTEWNRERSASWDRLYGHMPWGIVLHWFGDRPNYDKTITGYLRGFDSLRWIVDYLTRTSAHFLVGGETPEADSVKDDVAIGIVQTQKPYEDGTPLLASHLRNLDRELHAKGQQYFVRAFYQLGYSQPAVHSILQDMFDGPKVDPNQVTIAIEITGFDFDSQANFPSEQKIANTISVIWAVMKHYGINSTNVLGHHEIDLGKSDPGKKFMALIRILIGLKALLEKDPQMEELVFGQFLSQWGDFDVAVGEYFKYIRDYLLLVGNPKEVFDFESATKYWFMYDRLARDPSSLDVTTAVRFPLADPAGPIDLSPFRSGELEGVRIVCELDLEKGLTSASQDVRLIAPGRCLFTTGADYLYALNSAIFRHRLDTGGEIISVYANMNQLGDLELGTDYPIGYRVGGVECGQFPYTGFLHFAIAYAGTWDNELSHRPYVPLNAGLTWIEEHYLDPIAFLAEWDHPLGSGSSKSKGYGRTGIINSPHYRPR